MSQVKLLPVEVINNGDAIKAKEVFGWTDDLATSVADWYFRLNGFLTWRNYILHKSQSGGGNPLTDADIVGARYRYRSELATSSKGPLHDDEVLAGVEIAFCEVKSGQININGPWSNPSSGCIQEALRAVGCVDPKEVDSVASVLYSKREAIDGRCKIFAMGMRKPRDASQAVPNMLLFCHVLRWIHNRFAKHGEFKKNVNSWDIVGRRLCNDAETPADKFVKQWIKLIRDDTKARHAQ
ncbi:MAG: hypothetical protein AB7G17_08655 [Phycisphaerales bacterium]